MKIALCISGQPRSFEEGFIFLKHSILDHNINCDTFIHTWFAKNLIGKTFNTTHGASANKVGIYQENTIDQIINLYSPKSILVEEPKTFNTNSIKNFSDYNLRDGVQPNNVYSMFYSIYKSIQLKIEYEKVNDFIYDVVVRLRFDLKLSQPLNFKDYNLNTVIVPYSNNHSVVYDIFAFSNSLNMNFYGDTFINIPSVWSPNKHFIGEALLTDSLAMCNIPVTKINYEADLIRV